MNRGEAIRTALACSLMMTTLTTAPAQAIDNPLTANVRGVDSHLLEAAATIFGAGNEVLVDVTRYRGIVDGAAVTLNVGSCAKPGNITFSLSAFATYGSVTELPVSVREVSARAHSLVIHETADANSTVVACGNVVD